MKLLGSLLGAVVTITPGAAVTVVFELLETTSSGFSGSFAGESIPDRLHPHYTLPPANLCSSYMNYLRQQYGDQINRSLPSQRELPDQTHRLTHHPLFYVHLCVSSRQMSIDTQLTTKEETYTQWRQDKRVGTNLSLFISLTAPK